MSQSYKKRRRSCDLYELVVLVWEILTVIFRHIQVGRDLTPTFCAVFYRRGRFTKIGSETDVLFCLIKITANKRSSTRARTHIRMQCKGTGMIHDISKLLEFPICVCTDYDMYRGHGSIQGMRGVRKQRQQEEQNIWQPSRARAGYVLVQQQCSDYRVSLVSCSDTKITRTAVLK